MAEIAPATVLPVRIKIGGTSKVGWRGTLVSGSKTVWRCTCFPHRDYESAFNCGLAKLHARQAHSQQRHREVMPGNPAYLSRSDDKP